MTKQFLSSTNCKHQMTLVMQAQKEAAALASSPHRMEALNLKSILQSLEGAICDILQIHRSLTTQCYHYHKDISDVSKTPQVDRSPNKRIKKSNENLCDTRPHSNLE